MNRRVVIIAGGAAALLVVGGIVFVAQQQGNSSADASAPHQTPSSSALPTALPTALPSGLPLPDASPSVSPATPTPDDPAAPGSTDPGARFSTEVLPPAGPAPTSLPQSKPPPVLVSFPLPASKSSDDGLVDGFPSAAIATAPGSTITGSSVSSEDSRLHVTLTASSTRTGIDVLDYYRTAFAQLGLYDSVVPAVVGSSALAFTREDNSVTLTVTEAAGGCRYEIFAVFTAAAS